MENRLEGLKFKNKVILDMTKEDLYECIVHLLAVNAQLKTDLLDAQLKSVGRAIKS